MNQHMLCGDGSAFATHKEDVEAPRSQSMLIVWYLASCKDDVKAPLVRSETTSVKHINLVIFYYFLDENV